MLTYDSLKNNLRELLSFTGLTREEFEALLPAFERAYEQHHPEALTLQGQVRQRRAGAGMKAKLSRWEDKLLFILAYQKTAVLQTVHGKLFDLSQGQANQWIHRLLPVLQQALDDLGYAPARDARAVETHPLALEGSPSLVIDGTERRRQRPQNAQKQKEHYSGKKKAHTDKNLVLIEKTTGQVIYLSPTVAGKTHDKKAADEAQIAYPEDCILFQDTGFQGYAPEGVETLQPQKKPRGKELTEVEKWFNGVVSRVRVVVEHTIAGIKRCRIVKDLLRLTKEGVSDRVMEIACGLHNLRVSFRHS